MCADKYIQIDAVYKKKGIYFRHVESDVNKILGEFCTNMGIDGNLYQIRIYVIFEALMQH